MNAMTPSRVLEEYDITGRNVPARLVSEMRTKFAALEAEDVPVWKILCNEVADLDTEKKVDGDRLYVAQACAEVMLEVENNKAIDGLTWNDRIASLNTKEDFQDLFNLIGLSVDEWQSSGRLENNGFRLLYRVIRIRYKSWDAFKDFMCISRVDWKKEVAACDVSDDYIALFRKHGITGDDWQNSGWLKDNGFAQLYRVIRIRFGSWDKFKEFMSLTVVNWRKKVAACATSKEFLALFRKHGIKRDAWQSSKWLKNNEFAQLYRAIRIRFGSWDKFKDFMCISRVDWKKEVAACDVSDDYIALFRKHGIEGDEWQNSGWLQNNGFLQLYKAIKKRFNSSWAAFKEFMDLDAIAEDQAMQQITELALEDSVALLAERDPYKLKLYIQFAHPELNELEVDTLVTRAFTNFVMGRSQTREQEYLDYEEKLPMVAIDPVPTETDEPTVTISGTADAEFVYLSGVYTRRIRLEDGAFSVCVPLKIAKENELRIMAVDTTRGEEPMRSSQTVLYIEQISEEEDDIDTLIAILDNHGNTMRESIKRDPGRLQYFQQCAEQVLIKKFARSFSEGVEYVEGLIAETESPTVRKVLRAVLGNFKRIERTQFPNVEPGSLLFFQKYCAYEIRRRMSDAECPGVILANDPGLGKTRTVEAAISDKEGGIICPNAVVSAWDDEAQEVLISPDLLVLRNEKHAIRKKRLQTRTRMRYVTNIEFLRKTSDTERFELLGGNDMVLVHDEAHSRTSEHSQQSKGARMIDHQFQINVTATPAKNPEAARRLLRTLYPDDKRFASTAAFRKAFPADDPEALKTLSLILRKDTIRFRKQDVLEEIDPNQSLTQQKHRIPRKEFIPGEQAGQFTMGMKQAEAMYQMFLDWHKWTETYDRYIPTDKTAKDDGLRVAGALTKRHALRQSINNPGYIGAKGPDNKAEQTKAIVDDSIGRGRKVVIFCAYNAQAEKYAEMFAHLKPALYTGQTSEEGEKKGEDGKPMRFAREHGASGRKGQWKFGPNGYPIPDPDGDTMSTLDYERHTFQNCDDRQVIIATYQAGAVGTTFTAGKAMIFDDLPADVIEAIQAEDRIQRIDPDRQTHATVEYYQMISQYPEAFLAKMKKRWVVRDRESRCYREFTTQKAARAFASTQIENDEFEEAEKVQTAYDAFFAQGTYDEVHRENLVTQRHMFHLINDGIVDSATLGQDQIKFKGIENGNDLAMAV